LYVANVGDASISVVDTLLFQVTTTILLSDGARLALHPDERTLYAGTRNGIMVVDTASHSIRGVIHGPSGPLAVTPDGSTLYAADCLRDSVFVIDIETGEPVSEIPLPARACGGQPCEPLKIVIGELPEGCAPCVGDCNGDEGVRVNELVTGVDIALGQTALDGCRTLDRDFDGSVKIDELVTAVDNALQGCRYPEG
jgi:hypothetical protein